MYNEDIELSPPPPSEHEHMQINRTNLMSFDPVW